MTSVRKRVRDFLKGAKCMLCDICHSGHEAHELHEVEVYGAKFFVCLTCKGELGKERVRP